MKSIFFLFAISLITVGLQAQNCHGSSASMAGGSGCCSKSASAALVAADAAGIQVRKDVATGDIRFYKNTSCSQLTNVSYKEVRYVASKNEFVSISPDYSSFIIPASYPITNTASQKMDCSKMTPAECAEKMAKGECTGQTKATIASN